VPASALRSPTRIDGNLPIEVGFSLPLLRSLLADLDHSWIDLWTSRD
jgi:hypothetical protein